MIEIAFGWGPIRMSKLLGSVFLDGGSNFIPEGEAGAVLP